MKTPFQIDERLIKQGGANLQRGIETVGGQLYLTNQRLVFESHRLNVQTGAVIIPISKIVSVKACWTKFLNIIPLLPNSISVSTSDNQIYALVVFNRNEWLSAITAQRG
ncbi:hypothetical protein H6G89_10825 [Oscillatoria sp. FACHB-1407]|uniref:GRAM domain-containing protein n=1 Tax=Oscillatoria sp. FACHB-1407 TaxID=2692847 RepID=UPI001687FAB8|nr:GRAM domain-containing protein [Oscillatoria sp. FACHB-1407]MBD2461543.1 hypothetical protein [Oscillatoria sp. FACHB-1407]